jgi:hypothetical protein
MAVFAKLICRLSPTNVSLVFARCSSARSCLFVSGKYGTGLASTVCPDLDMERDLRNAHDVAESLAARNLDATKFDLKAIANSAKYMQWLEAEDARLEARCRILRGIWWDYT